jgi:hypothetical protein
MVADCRRCGRSRLQGAQQNMISQIATTKLSPTELHGQTPSASNLPNRHRRLCSTCLSLPLSYHTLSPTPPYLPRHTCPTSTFTSTAFTRNPAPAPTPSGSANPAAPRCATPTQPTSVWTWRTYSTNLGGLGTGIGEAMKVGRGDRCFAAKYTEVESDCGAEHLAAPAVAATRRRNGDGDGEG